MRTTHTAFTRVDWGSLWSRRAQIQCSVCLRSLGWRDILLSSPCVWRWVDHILPKKLKPVGRLLVLPPSLRDARECLRPDARLERLAERLCPFERLNDRDDGMKYTYDLENNFGDIRLRRRT